jgi:hypothetical protein
MRSAGLIVIAFMALVRVAAQTPTWSGDIACIVYTHCTPCHHEGGVGHFDLTSYADAYFWRNEMAFATAERIMPPWPPDPDYRTLAHERMLTQDEIDAIAAWVNADAPEGDPQVAPPAPVYSGAAQITDPDISAIMEDFVIPSSTSDLYRCFVLPIDNPVDRFITGLEVLPGNREMVHHVLVFQDTSGQAQVLDAQDPAPGYTSFGGIGVQSAKLVGMWVPGAEPFFTPPGMGIKLFANADLVMQIHYPATSNEAEVDSTRIHLQLTTAPLTRNLSIDPVLDHLVTITDGPLVIPPNEIRTFHAQYTTTFPATITAVGPHSHLLGKRMRAYAVLPVGDTIPLIDIPNWDFRWQDLYSFRQPIYLPTGTTLFGEATYDNTSGNPNNPSDPPQWVFLGEATTNEMMLFYFAWTFGSPGDANIVVDTAAHAGHYLDCVPDVIADVPDAAGALGPQVWPSPAHDMIMVSGLMAGDEMRLIDARGRILKHVRPAGQQETLSVGDLASGIVFLEVRNASGSEIRRVKVLLE